jgi:hypothetical protein
MTEAEARELCAQLAREHPDHDAHQWFAREAPKPPQADDPRQADQRNAPGASG